MREIGYINSRKLGERFISVLMADKIMAELREGDSNRLEIWVHEEKNITKSEKILKEFLKTPDSKKFIQTAIKGEEVRGEQKKEIKFLKKNRIDLKTQFYRGGRLSARATIGLIIICVLLFFLENMGGSRQSLNFLYYSDFFNSNFHEIKSGQIWRIFTPSLLHGGILHLLFNTLWLLELGGMIERDKGPVKFLGLVLLTSFLTNTAQYLSSGPNFLGMSGVIYGLFGFAWMKTKFEYNSNYFLSPMTVGFLLTWFFLCIFGIFDRIANTSHGVGLCVGIICGFISSGYLKNFHSLKKLKLQQILAGLLPFLFAALGIASDVLRH